MLIMCSESWITIQMKDNESWITMQINDSESGITMQIKDWKSHKSTILIGSAKGGHVLVRRAAPGVPRVHCDFLFWTGSTPKCTGQN